MSAVSIIELDVTAPVAVVSGDTIIDPPEAVSLTITSSKPLGAWSLSWMQSTGEVLPVGAEQTGDRVLVVIVPSDRLFGGVGSIVGWVADDVGNRATVAVPVTIRRDIPFVAVLSLGDAFDVQFGMARG